MVPADQRRQNILVKSTIRALMCPYLAERDFPNIPGLGGKATNSGCISGAEAVKKKENQKLVQALRKHKPHIFLKKSILNKKLNLFCIYGNETAPFY